MNHTPRSPLDDLRIIDPTNQPDRTRDDNPQPPRRSVVILIVAVLAVVGVVAARTGGGGPVMKSPDFPLYSSQNAQNTAMYVPGSVVDEFESRKRSTALTTSGQLGGDAVATEDGSTGSTDNVAPPTVPAVGDGRPQQAVDTLLERSVLLSLTAAQEAIGSGRYHTAWIDDSHRALLLDAGTGASVLAFYPDGYESQLVALLEQAGLEIVVGPTFDLSERGDGDTNWLLLLVVMAIGAVLLWANRSRLRRAGAVRDQAGEGVPTTRFSDIAGVDEALEDMHELVEFLSHPERYDRLGAKTPRGALLYGPPGTGKTLMARAVAGEAGVPFFAVAGSDFVEKYVGVGARRVRDLFAQARKADRALVFIDEIDAVAARRSADAGSGVRESENTLIALLNEMDGFAGTHVIVIAATNRPDLLDPAITRPGRLDRKIAVPAPDRRGREQIFVVHSRRCPVAVDVDFVALARRTPGMTGAEIAQIVNEAAIHAARTGLDHLDMACFDNAIATVTMGRARTSALVTDSDRLITAWHEAGHTLCAFLQPDADRPVSVSVVPRGPAGGVTWMTGSDDQFVTVERARARLVTSLGGRAGEEILLNGSFTQGAHGDLEAATAQATAMATQYGMTRLGLMIRQDTTSTEVHAVVEELLRDALDEARRLVSGNRRFMELLVAELLDKETLDAAEIAELARRSGSRVVPVTSRRAFNPTVSSTGSTAGPGSRPRPESSRPFSAADTLLERARRLLRRKVHGD